MKQKKTSIPSSFLRQEGVQQKQTRSIVLDDSSHSKDMDSITKMQEVKQQARVRTVPRQKRALLPRPVEEGPPAERVELTLKKCRFALPSRTQILNWIPFWSIILLGAFLRFWGLGDKALHHDESLHAYFSLQLLHNLEHWSDCFSQKIACYHYDPLLHGPFQFHAIALFYKIAQLFAAPENGVNTTTVRLAAAILGTLLIALPYFLRQYLGRMGSLLSCFLLAVSPSMVYFSRFAREDIYMACFTLLLVVGLACYIRSRKAVWLVVAAVAFALSYATKEATFLTIAIFGSFFALLLIWEIGGRVQLRRVKHKKFPFSSFLPRTAAPIFLVLFVAVLAPVAKLFFTWMKDLSVYVNDPKNAASANAFVSHLKENTLAVLPWLATLLAVYVVTMLVRDFLRRRKQKASELQSVAIHSNTSYSPILNTLLTSPWWHWVLALLSVVSVFLVLFTVLFTHVKGGIGDGIWQGLYYWLQQQQVARGGQPWYYYLLLIPLYEQIGLVFGIVGIIRCLTYPSRFRLFLIYWFVGNLCIYSWAGEKMPWLMIHMVMPLQLLAAIGLEPLLVKIAILLQNYRGTAARISARDWRESSKRVQDIALSEVFSQGKVLFGGICATALLILTLQNMLQVTYVHAADGPHEMMVYVQTTTDVNLVMSKIAALDQRLHKGTHQLTMGVTADASWPFYWYLRDYTNVCYNFPANCSTPNPEVIVSAGDTVLSTQTQYATATKDGRQPNYLFHEYALRSWWDEGYKPPPCVPNAQNTCQGEPTWGGIGPFLWLSYGDTPPPNASFNPFLAVRNIWQWWWQRKAFGSIMGATNMGFLIRKDLATVP